MLKKISFTSLIAFSLLLSCNDKKNVPNTDMDVSRAFIKDILDDNLDEARTLVLPDTTNIEYFSLFTKQYHSKSKSELDGFKGADIIINEINNVNDSVTIINYSNSYKKGSNNIIKAVRVNGKWMVDFKYTFSGNL